MKESVWFEAVEHDSPEYWKSVELRREVLRKPLGLDFTAAELAVEEDQDHLVGFLESDVACVAVLVEADKKTAKMRQVAVRGDLQGKGVGRRLVEAFEILALEQGFKKVELHARANVVPFYESLGYEVVGEEFVEVGIPHRAMSKKLG